MISLIKINQEITKKLEELEKTGLSREEILLSKSQVPSSINKERLAA